LVLATLGAVQVCILDELWGSLIRGPLGLLSFRVFFRIILLVLLFLYEFSVLVTSLKASIDVLRLGCLSSSPGFLFATVALLDLIERLHRKVEVGADWLRTNHHPVKHVIVLIPLFPHKLFKGQSNPGIVRPILKAESSNILHVVREFQGRRIPTYLLDRHPQFDLSDLRVAFTSVIRLKVLPG
jgi:hypothetical protein